MKKLFVLLAIAAVFLSSCQKDQPAFEQIAIEEVQDALPAEFDEFEDNKEIQKALESLRNDPEVTSEKAGLTFIDLNKWLPKVGADFYYSYMNQNNNPNYSKIKVTYAKFTGSHIGIVAQELSGNRKVTLIMSLTNANIQTPACTNTSGITWPAQSYNLKQSWASVKFTGNQANAFIGGSYDNTAPYTCTIGSNNILGTQATIPCKSVLARTTDDRSVWFSWPDAI